MNGWHFLATEVDDICFDYATKNVEQNKMSEFIKGKSGSAQPEERRAGVCRFTRVGNTRGQRAKRTLRIIMLPLMSPGEARNDLII